MKAGIATGFQMANQGGFPGPRSSGYYDALAHVVYRLNLPTKVRNPGRRVKSAACCIFAKKSMDSEKTDAFYDRLKEELLKSTSWPSDYLYKFIIPTNVEKAKQISAIFDNTGAVIQSKQSRNGKYTSLSVTVHLNNPDEVIAKYREVGKVEGVISL
jgi:putative lipoic acid-binding regulatory protein